MTIFEGNLYIIGNIRHKSIEYNYNINIDYYSDIPSEFEINIEEHGLSTELENEIKSEILKQFEGKTLKFI